MFGRHKKDEPKFYVEYGYAEASHTKGPFYSREEVEDCIEELQRRYFGEIDYIAISEVVGKNARSLGIWNPEEPAPGYWTERFKEQGIRRRYLLPGGSGGRGSLDDVLDGHFGEEDEDG